MHEVVLIFGRQHNVRPGIINAAEDIIDKAAIPDCLRPSKGKRGNRLNSSVLSILINGGDVH